jgi:hypothetical protein
MAGSPGISSPSEFLFTPPGPEGAGSFHISTGHDIFCKNPNKSEALF